MSKQEKQGRVRQMRKITFGSILILGILLLFTHESFSASFWETKDLKVRIRELKIFVNGQLMTTRAEPLILEEGITMVPLRDLSEALGFAVDWHEDTGEIRITGVPLSTYVDPDKYWLGKKKQLIEKLTILRNVGPFYQKKSRDFKIAGRSFAYGVAVNKDGDKAEVVLNLNKKYSTVEGYYGVEDETMNSRSSFRLTFLGDDQEIYTSDVVRPSHYPSYLGPGEIYLGDINRLTIQVQWEDTGLGNYDDLIAVLANFNFYLK